MEVNQFEVVVYPPPKDGLPYAIIAIIKGNPEHVAFESTPEQADAHAKVKHELLWRTQHVLGGD